MTTTTSPTQTAAATIRAVLDARRQQPGAANGFITTLNPGMS